MFTGWRNWPCAVAGDDAASVPPAATAAAAARNDAISMRQQVSDAYGFQTMSEETPRELLALREQIATVDREVLGALNRRLELVARVQEHKQATGAPTIDAQREADLLQELAESNPGPLSS